VGGIAVVGDGSAVVVPGGELIRTQILDPDTSLVLADQTSVGNNSDPVSDTLILEVGWTNEKPHKPALP
jgi:hypothetical protein